MTKNLPLSTPLIALLGALLTPMATQAAGTAAKTETRQPLKLAPMQRDHVLDEMRALLAGSQQIVAALARDDMAAVAAAARPLGMGMARKAENHLGAALPRDFMRQGMAVHQDFDRIADDAEARKDPRLTLRQLGETMGRCVACHASFRIESASAAAHDDHAEHDEHDSHDHHGH
jgi:cytochrome c556